MTLIEQVAMELQNKGIGTLGSSIFVGARVLDGPNMPDSIVCVMDTGGLEPPQDVTWKVPTFQVFIRSTDYDTGKATLDSVKEYLHQKKNTYIGGGDTFFYYIYAISEGGPLGPDENGRELFSVNFRCKVREA